MFIIIILYTKIKNTYYQHTIIGLQEVISK